MANEKFATIHSVRLGICGFLFSLDATQPRPAATKQAVFD
jgi:hypothetical protein